MTPNKPYGYWKSWINFERELQQVIHELGHFPSSTELQNLGKGSIATCASKYYGGMRAVRSRMEEESDFHSLSRIKHFSCRIKGCTDPHKLKGYCSKHSTYFKGLCLTQADFQGADLRGADFQGADLRGADFQGADLRGANFQAADLRGADFQGADLRGANFQFAELDDAVHTFPYALLFGVVGLEKHNQEWIIDWLVKSWNRKYHSDFC